MMAKKCAIFLFIILSFHNFAPSFMETENIRRALIPKGFVNASGFRIAFTIVSL